MAEGYAEQEDYKAPRGQQVVEWTERALLAVQNLEKELADLEDRLAPVLRQRSPGKLAPEQGQDVEGLVPIASTFRELASEVDKHRDRVRSMSERCEL